MLNFRIKNNSIDFPENMLSSYEQNNIIDHGYAEEDVFSTVSEKYKINKTDLIRLSQGTPMRINY